MRKSSQGIRLSVLFAATLLLGATGSQAQTSGTISIGAVLPLTGPSATVGEDIRRGVMMAIDKVNEQGGVHGRVGGKARGMQFRVAAGKVQAGTLGWRRGVP